MLPRLAALLHSIGVSISKREDLAALLIAWSAGAAGNPAAHQCLRE
jgi:hypothetical protein